MKKIFQKSRQNLKYEGRRNQSGIFESQKNRIARFNSLRCTPERKKGNKH